MGQRERERGVDTMRATGVSLANLEAAAEAVGVLLKPGSHPGKFGLALDKSRSTAPGALPAYQRRSENYAGRSRRVAAVCWHGHRDFLWSLFKSCPDAVVYSGIARFGGEDIVYRGLVDYCLKFEATGDRNIGNQYNMLAYCDACYCPPEVSEAHYDWPAPSEVLKSGPDAPPYYGPNHASEVLA